MANDETVPAPDDTTPLFEGVGPGMLGPLPDGLEDYSAPGVWVEEGALPPVPDTAQEAEGQETDDDATPWQKVEQARNAVLAFLRDGPDRNGLTRDRCSPLLRAVRLFDEVLADFEKTAAIHEKATLSESGNITQH